MDDTVRESLRQRLERALDAIDRLRPAPSPALQPIPVGPGRAQRGSDPGRRTVRPVRAWARLLRI